MDIGIDMIEISKFRLLLEEKRERFIKNTFSKLEQEYCVAYSDPAPHLAGTFAAKEAVRKASGLTVPFNEIEIRRTETGKPEVWLENKRAHTIHISITHTEKDACAIALNEEK